MSIGWDRNGFILNLITVNGHFDRAQKPLIFSSLKLSLQLKSFGVLLRRNNLATITALTGKSYLPVRKINMFVDRGVKVRGLDTEASRLFLAP